MFYSGLWSTFKGGGVRVSVLFRALEHFQGWWGESKCSIITSQIVLQFRRVRFQRLLTLPNRFTVSQGTIPAFAYPLRSFYGFAGYDSGVCLPSQIVLRFCRARFRRLLTLPDRFTVLLGTILAFAYPPRSFYSFAGYDSGICLPSQIVLQFRRVRFKRFHTLPNRFTV